jgi:hypothetical protein
MSSSYYIPLLVVILVITALFFAGMSRLTGSVNSSSKKAASPEEMYVQLRNSALSAKAKDIGVESNGQPLVVYGVVMDLPLSSGTATIASFSTGDTSMYTSTGGGIIGGIGHESCRIASQHFIKVAQDHIEKMRKSFEYPLPPKGVFRFYVVTTQGVYTCEDTEAALTRGTSPLSSLFLAGNDVITQLRLNSLEK